MAGKALEKMQALRQRGFPTGAAIELTTRCNLSCKYCFVTPSPSELTTSELCSVIDRLAESGIISLLLTGGEPFLRTDIMTILDHIISRNFFDTVILTNGTCISWDHITLLQNHKKYFGYIRFSFFSHKPQVHDAFTGEKGSFDAALAAADALHTAGVTVWVIINLTESNIDTLDETTSFFKDRGFQTHIGPTKINTTEEIKEDFAQTTSISFYRKYLSRTTPEGRKILREKFETQCLHDPFNNLLCEKMFGMFSILANGDMVPCLSFRNHTIGNILTDHRPVHEIARSSAFYRELRNTKRSDVDPCRTCRFVNFCILCPGMMFSENGTWRRPMKQTCNYATAYYEMLYE